MAESTLDQKVERALQSHVEILDLSRERNHASVVEYVAHLVGEVRNHERAIPALKCIRDVCSSFPVKTETIFVSRRSGGLVYRHEMMARLANTLSITTISVESLLTYIKKVNHFRLDHPSVPQQNFRLDNHYHHTQEVQERLDFLTFWLKNGHFQLRPEQAREIWKCLVFGIFASDKDACLEWFSALMEEDKLEEGVLRTDSHHDFFVNYINQVLPCNWNKKGFHLFERFFESDNIKQGNMTRKHGRCMTKTLRLIGLDYLWRVIITGQKDIAQEATRILVKVHLDLSPSLRPDRAKVNENFVASCVKRLKVNFKTISYISPEMRRQENLYFRTEYIAIVRILAVLRDFVAASGFCDVENLEDRARCSLERVSQNSLHALFLRQLANWASGLRDAPEPSIEIEVLALLESPITNPSLMSVLRPLSTLANDFQKLFLSYASSDFVFVVGEEEIPAHKLVLNTRIPYFEQLFASGMREAVSNRVTIEDMNTESFKQLLRYVYTGQLPDGLKESPQIFLPSAEKYDMQELKAACVGTMIQNINKHNVVEFVIMAHLFRCADLKTECFQLLKEWKSSMPDESLDLLKSHPELLLEFVKKA